ncbi:MAG: HAD family hydrolase [Nanoarchaeota archaeon]
MTNKKAVVFDLYDTLLYNQTNNKPYSRLFSELSLQGGDLTNAYKIALTEGFDSLTALISRLKPDAKIDVGRYDDEIGMETTSASLYPETIMVLDGLKARDIKLGLISNVATPYKKPFFGLGLDKHFDKIILSCDIGSMKPEREIYERMIKELSMEPRFVIMTGNNVHDDVEGPRYLGIDAVHLDRKNGSPGSISTLEGIFDYL